MRILDLVIIGVGLSMDACCISISNGMSTKNFHIRHALANAFFFGVFQGIMPIIGFFAGSLFVDILSRYSFWLVFAIFFLLGAKMLYDSFHSEEEILGKPMTARLLTVQAVATSIDALAIGVSFSALRVDIFPAASIIAVTTFILSFIAIFIGKKVGLLLNKKAGMLGGILLFIMAFRVLIEGIIG